MTVTQYKDPYCGACELDRQESTKRYKSVKILHALLNVV